MLFAAVFKLKLEIGRSDAVKIEIKLELFRNRNSLLLVECFCVTLINKLFHLLFCCTAADELFYLIKSFKHSVFKNDFSSCIHESEKCFSSVEMLVVLFIVPSDCFLLNYFELNSCVVIVLRVVSFSALSLQSFHPCLLYLFS